MAELPRGTVLLVDDEALIRELVERMLVLAGFGVVCCSSGEEALLVDTERGGSVDVLLSDVQLNSMKGPTLAAEMRFRHPSIGIVLMSGGTEAEAVDEGMTPGTRFLGKPYTREELVGAVEAVLASRSDP